MSFKAHAITDFSRFHEDELGPVSTTIFNSLSANAGTFPALPVVVLTLNGQITAYATILGKPEYHGKAADLAAARLTLEESLKKNGIYVNGVANGDEAILAKSGYPLAKPHEPVGPLAKGTLKVHSTDNPGEFEYEITGVPHARGYLLCYTEATNTETDPKLWPWHWCPASKGIITELKASTKYKLSAVGLGTNPALSFTDMIERTTQ